jgi:hypothetical protein
LAVHLAVHDASLAYGKLIGIVKLTADRKNPFHSAGISAASEALTSHLAL